MPEKPVGRFGRPLFQAMSYHDTPGEAAAGACGSSTRRPSAGQASEYRVIAVNGVGLESEPSPAVQGP